MLFNTEFEEEIIKWGLEINEIIKIIKISEKKTIQKKMFENKFSIDWFPPYVDFFLGPLKSRYMEVRL
jgi:hypothetical protein